MNTKPTVLFFFNDWPVHPSGANCGGGETATMSLAEAFSRAGYRTVACAHLPDGDTEVRGVEYWNFGKEYAVETLLPRIAELGEYYAFAATLVHPFMLLKGDKNCLRKILINHSPGVNPSGLESKTVMHMIDRFVCVSEAQKQVVLARNGVSEERMVVIRNGFNPNLFQYAGPEERDWNQLMYAGRLEPSKGIHHLLGAFTNLKRSFPDLKLSVFGDQTCWPSLQEQIPHIQASTPGLTFHGKVPQTRIAEELRRAGCLVFPSLSFESAGLSVLDAQASGCPVVASDIGGVKEYLIPECGVLVEKLDPQKLELALAQLLSDVEKMKEMSQKGEILARTQTWDLVASELLDVAAQPVPPIKEEVSIQKIASEGDPLEVVKENDSLYRTWFVTGIPYDKLMEDHDVIASGVTLEDSLLLSLPAKNKKEAVVKFWQGLRLDALERKDEALQSFKSAYSYFEGGDWQTTFRLVLLETELGDLRSAAGHATELLDQHPEFPLREDLSRLVNQINAAGA